MHTRRLHGSQSDLTCRDQVASEPCPCQNHFCVKPGVSADPRNPLGSSARVFPEGPCSGRSHRNARLETPSEQNNTRTLAVFHTGYQQPRVAELPAAQGHQEPRPLPQRRSRREAAYGWRSATSRAREHENYSRNATPQPGVADASTFAPHRGPVTPDHGPDLRVAEACGVHQTDGLAFLSTHTVVAAADTPARAAARSGWTPARTNAQNASRATRSTATPCGIAQQLLSEVLH